jgi:hypothetical protein
MFGFGRKKADEALITAMGDSDAAAVARLVPAQDFVMISDSEAPAGGNSPLMLEVDGFPAVAAFTSQENAAAFGEEFPDAAGPDGTLPAFVVGGANFLKFLPEGVGAVINPAGERCAAVMAPAMVSEVKRLLS